jgi:hypothetical protein
MLDPVSGNAEGVEVGEGDAGCGVAVGVEIVTVWVAVGDAGSTVGVGDASPTVGVGDAGSTVGVGDTGSTVAVGGDSVDVGVASSAAAVNSASAVTVAGAGVAISSVSSSMTTTGVNVNVGMGVGVSVAGSGVMDGVCVHIMAWIVKSAEIAASVFWVSTIAICVASALRCLGSITKAYNDMPAIVNNIKPAIIPAIIMNKRLSGPVGGVGWLSFETGSDSPGSILPSPPQVTS